MSDLVSFLETHLERVECSEVPDGVLKVIYCPVCGGRVKGVEYSSEPFAYGDVWYADLSCGICDIGLRLELGVLWE